MVTRSVWRFVHWVLRPDADVARRPEFALSCESCADASGTRPTTLEAQDWALRHAGRTGHETFRAVYVCFFRAVRKEEAR